MQSVKDKYTAAIPNLKTTLGADNMHALPTIKKVVISSGTGSTKDKKKFEVVMDRLAKITGQKPSPRASKKSEAGFKLREGDVIGAQVTLRGARMYDFLDRLFNVAIPRERDFRGIKIKSIDDIGNITLGITEHTIFPETADEDISDIFGFAVTIVTSAKNKKEAEELFRVIGVPFKKT